MGVALAAAARDLGAEVTLLAGPGVTAPAGVASSASRRPPISGALLARAGAATPTWSGTPPRWPTSARPPWPTGSSTAGRAACSSTLEPVPDLAAGMPRRGRTRRTW